MRKSRIKLTDVSTEIFNELVKGDKTFGALESLAIKVPDWAKLILVASKPDKGLLEAGFFEDAKDFFLFYTKKVLRTSGLQITCLSRELTNEWKSFTPPTLIGTNLETKLRKK
jgi:hypothetical protein